MTATAIAEAALALVGVCLFADETIPGLFTWGEVCASATSYRARGAPR